MISRSADVASRVLYHWTRPRDVESILAHGLRDSTYEPRGVHLSEHPTLHPHPGDVRITVYLPMELDISRWINPIELPGARDYVIPEGVLRVHARLEGPESSP